MRWLTTLFTLVALLGLADGREARGRPAPPAGVWLGGVEFPDRFLCLRLRLTAPHPTGVRVDLPVRNQQDVIPERVDWDGTWLTLRLALPDLPLEIRLRGGRPVWRGTAHHGGPIGPAVLRPCEPVDGWGLDDLTGHYRHPEGREVFVKRVGNELFWFEDDQLTTLLPLDPRRFLLATGPLVGFTGRRDGGTGQVSVPLPDGRTHILTRLESTRREERFFAHGDITLAGSIHFPDGSGPFPGLVMVHGSGPQPRDAFRLFAEHFARHGIATLIYDKRGTGASSGDRHRASFDDLAGDALAAVGHLRQHPLVDPATVGLWGISQGGWVVSRAMALDPTVAFAVLVSAPGVNPARQELFRLSQEMRGRDIPEHLISRTRRVWAATYGGDRSPRLEAAIRRLHERFPRLRPWLPPSPGRTPDHAWYRHLDPAFDPTAHLAGTRAPLLLVYGAADRLVPVPDSIAAWGDTPVHPEIRVFPAADHGLFQTPADPPGGSRRFAAGYLETMTDWIQRTTARSARAWEAP